jgi:small subunit ribosomal protein S14
MAKKAWIERVKKRQELVNQYAALRDELKARHDYVGLAKLPRNSSSVRRVNRCRISGRRHAYLRKFNVSRLVFRELAMAGMLPGVTKASW